MRDSIQTTEYGGNTCTCTYEVTPFKMVSASHTKPNDSAKQFAGYRPYPTDGSLADALERFVIVGIFNVPTRDNPEESIEVCTNKESMSYSAGPMTHRGMCEEAPGGMLRFDSSKSYVRGFEIPRGPK